MIDVESGPVNRVLPFKVVYRTLRSFLLTRSDKVDVGEWHAMDVKGNPALVSHELRAVTFHTSIARTPEKLQDDVEPNLPWAEDQFQERVAGDPVNPGETYKRWPWQSQMVKHKPEVFSHTYMERYWPRYAQASHPEGHSGIRYRYGDLTDLVDLLRRSPDTRQAVLPVWFPEDTGAVHGGRVPCSLTYHFLRRRDLLHVEYSIRSCDFVRHFRDDVYMTARLVQWVLSKLERGKQWKDVKPGALTMHIGSLHYFEGDKRKLEREVEQDVIASIRR